MDALNKIGKKTMIAIVNHLGPVMGIKVVQLVVVTQVLPMEDINLHFTGDMPLQLPTMLFLPWLINHLHQGNELGIDQRRILWKRVVDLNDRALRRNRWTWWSS